MIVDNFFLWVAFVSIFALLGLGVPQSTPKVKSRVVWYK